MDQLSPHPSVGAEDIVDLNAYPIADDDDDAARRLVAEACGQFDDTGFCVLPGFIRPDALADMVAEANDLAPLTYYCRQSHDVYLGTGEHGPLEETFVGSVAYDLLPDTALLRALYDWDPLKDFIAAVLRKPVLHRLADPLGACTINVFCRDGRHGWHFDEAEFTVTLMLQAPARGGVFEYVPNIRGRRDEAAVVGRILDGDRGGVVELPFTPGALLIFGGRRTLHRVTTVAGDRLRLVPVLCYATRPDQRNSDDVRRLFWGRTTAIAATA